MREILLVHVEGSRYRRLAAYRQAVDLADQLRLQRRLLYVARGSAYETEHWIDRALSRDLLPDTYQSRITEVIRTLNGLIRAHRQNN